MCENFRKPLFDLHDSEFFTFPDFWYTFGMFNLPWSFQPPHLQEPILDPPLHHPNLLQGPHLWVPTITPFGPILVYRLSKLIPLFCLMSKLQPLLPPLTCPPQVPTAVPAPQATPSFCPWRPWEEKTNSFCHQVLRSFSLI